ncbi:MAG: zinc-ribbon domain-containing protein, partial [Planctomycetales bacterium]|nr:zinc-ribbon domain-containing protein [Planctomycetales bacterium]
MPISVTCPKCSTTLKVKDELAGKRGKCPKCQGPVQIPTAEQSAVKTWLAVTAPKRSETAVKLAVPATMEERRAKVLDPLAGILEKPQAPFSFRFRMLLAAMAICLLPALYTVLILLFGGGAIVWYLYAPHLLGNSSGAVLLYLPLAAGLLIAILLLKPLIAPRPSKGKVKPLSRDKAPLLFEFVDK